MRQTYEKAAGEALDRAAAASSLDTSCRILQEALGIQDGGVAGFYFSGDDPGTGVPYVAAWPDLSPADRREELLAYLRTEEGFRVPEPPCAGPIANDK